MESGLSFTDILGWIGAIEVLTAYLLVSINKVDGKSITFQLLNLTGAVFLIINTVALKAYPSAFVNVIWSGIAIYFLVKRK
ncbi:MAG TPA: hypothetical protein VNW99_13205 [Cytophagaceae bacterium]|jgi:hypothetical protein|nr:hypothetical protein [Cytophagaceae bacterium]